MSVPREEKYQKILDAAIESFAQYGYHQCQVSKIARLAGVADGTIYLYFKNKEEILIKLFEERMGKFIKSIREELKNCSNTRMRLRAIVRTHFSHMENNRNIAVVTQVEIRQPNPTLRAAITTPLKEYFRLIEEVIEEGIRQKEVKPVNVRIAREMVFGTIDQVVTGWVYARSERSLIQDADAVLELLAGALLLPEQS